MLQYIKNNICGKLNEFANEAKSYVLQLTKLSKHYPKIDDLQKKYIKIMNPREFNHQNNEYEYENYDENINPNNNQKLERIDEEPSKESED